MSWIPKGAKPAGIEGSVNEPARLKLPSKISTLLLAASAANKELPDVLLVIASPVYTAPAVFAPINAVLGSNADHPLMVPSRVANRKTEVQLSILNSVEP